jgi:cobalamin biosynthesis Mg chelatase CobN
MVVGATATDHGPMDLLPLFLAAGLLAAASVGIAAVAGVRAADPQASPARTVGLSILAAVMILFAVFVVGVVYLFWRFTVDFTF